MCQKQTAIKMDASAEISTCDIPELHKTFQLLYDVAGNEQLQVKTSSATLLFLTELHFYDILRTVCKEIEQLDSTLKDCDVPAGSFDREVALKWAQLRDYCLPQNLTPDALASLNLRRLLICEPVTVK